MGLTDYVNANDAGANQQRQGRARTRASRRDLVVLLDQKTTHSLRRYRLTRTCLLRPRCSSRFKKVTKDPSVTGGGSSKECGGGDDVADAGAQRRKPKTKAPKGGIGSFFGGGRAVGAAQGKHLWGGGWVGGCRRAPVVTCLMRGIGGFRGFRLS